MDSWLLTLTVCGVGHHPKLTFSSVGPLMLRLVKRKTRSVILLLQCIILYELLDVINVKHTAKGLKICSGVLKKTHLSRTTLDYKVS